MNPFDVPIARHIWETRYRYRDDGRVVDGTPQETMRRVARAVASVEKDERAVWERRFYEVLARLAFLPGGRILAGAGTRRRVTLFNCFVLGQLDDTMDGIFNALKEAAITLQQGGGVGCDFSTLRPRGTVARAVGGVASGPVSFMRIWDCMCDTLLSTGVRRGAMMATLRCDHPDIEAFIDAKGAPGQLRHFNLSVLISDEYMRAVREDAEWPLVFPLAAGEIGTGPLVERQWSGRLSPGPCRVHRTVPARRLWQRILRAAYDSAEPGVLFVDRINRENNLGYRERLSSTNPCGEIPLPPYGACDLGSINLTRFLKDPLASGASIDLEGIAATTAIGVRLLDNVIELSRYPFAAQERQAKASRRIGLGITGLADALALLGLPYGSEQARACAAAAMRTICHAAYRTSIELARQRGPFPHLERERYLARPFVRSLPEELRVGIAEHGLRNSHLLAVAPTGTISVLAGNISSGLEPLFGPRYIRDVMQSDGRIERFTVESYCYRLWRERHGDTPPPPSFVYAADVSSDEDLRMQATIQRYVDNAISKTVSVAQEISFEAFGAIYEQAYALGLKGCTVYRPNPIRGAVLACEPVQECTAPACREIDAQ